jgi:hypothetical protein
VSRLLDFERMGWHVRGRPFADWPGWSTGEVLIVALVLNRCDVLNAMGYTIVEALDRVDLAVSDLRAIERNLKNGNPPR